MSCKFGWKRKAGGQVDVVKSSIFEKESKDEDDNEVTSGEVDWLNLLPKKKKIMVLEDAVAKSNRLKQEGMTLADAERYWEAIKKWEGALQFTPEDETIHEMMSQSTVAKIAESKPTQQKSDFIVSHYVQAYTILHEVYPAVRAAKKAIQIKPTWWVAYQTLGRAELNLGEVGLAIKSFSRAIHINPACKDLWEEDLIWTRQLLEQKTNLEKQLKQAVNDCQATVTEITEDTEQAVEKYQTKPGSGDKISNSGPGTNYSNSPESVRRMPSNYVQMRDVVK